MNQGDLSKVTGLGKSSNGRNLEKLGRGEFVKENGVRKLVPGLNWVETYRDPLDRRFQKVRLTSWGRAALDEVMAEIVQEFDITTRKQTP